MKITLTFELYVFPKQITTHSIGTDFLYMLKKYLCKLGPYLGRKRSQGQFFPLSFKSGHCRLKTPQIE